MIAINAAMDLESILKLINRYKRAQLVAVTACLGTSLAMAFFVGDSSPFIGLMLAIITFGVYLMIVSGKWKAKNTQ